MQQFIEHLRAGFPAIWLQTQEPVRAVSELSSMAKAEGWQAFTWDCQSGFLEIGSPAAQNIPEPDPANAVKFLMKTPKKAILFLMNFHKFIPAVEVYQETLNRVDEYKASGKVLVVVSPFSGIPAEVEKVFIILRYDLPNRETLLRVLRFMAESAERDLPNTTEIEKILDAGRGLTAWEYENALALSLVTKKCFDADIVHEQKKQMVKKNASLIIEEIDETLESLGGMENLKLFCLKVATSQLSKGVLLLGIPGTGKSHFSKGLGKALGIPTAALDFGRMFGSLVGESEERIRGALDVVDSFSPCVLRIDEIEKGLSGIKSSGSTDGGTGSRVFGTFLNWLQDHKSRVFVVATCNDIQAMPPEFLRAERWDAIFFVDLPTAEERKVIFEIYQKQYNVTGTPPDMEGWSGAEIKSLCRIAAMMETPLEQAASYIMPLSVSMSEKIQGLRAWARTRTIPASVEKKPTGRRVES